MFIIDLSNTTNNLCTGSNIEEESMHSIRFPNGQIIDLVELGFLYTQGDGRYTAKSVVGYNS